MYLINHEIYTKLNISNVAEIIFHPFISFLGNNMIQDAKEMERRKTMINLNDSIPPAKCVYSVTNHFYFRIYRYAIKVSSLHRVILHDIL